MKTIEVDDRSDTEKYQKPDFENYQFQKISTEDPLVWQLYQSGDVKGLFQVESALCQQWCKKIKPKNLDELSALISLVRPGGLESGFCEKYANIKNGLEEPSYIHPALEPILGKTYSCLVFQESILRICIDIAGFSDIEADNARRAVGHKLPEEMDKVKVLFMEGSAKKGIVSKEIAEEIFSWIQKSVRYLFCAGHSYSYSYTSYFGAYQKRYFPTEFYTSALTFSDEKLDPKLEVYELVQDAKRHNVKILPPDIRERNIDFKILRDKLILFGLCHIRNIGRASIEELQDPENDFSTFTGVLKSLGKVKRSVIESIIKSGGCDCYGLSRNQMLRTIYVICGRNEVDLRGDDLAVSRPLSPIELKYFHLAIGQFTVQQILQKILDEEICIKTRRPAIEAKLKYLENIPKETNRQKAIWEKLYLGLNLTCSAADDFTKNENAKTCKEIYSQPVANEKEWKNKGKNSVTMHVVVDSIKEVESKTNGNKFGILKVSDSSGVLDLMVFSKNWEQYKPELMEGIVCCINGRKNLFKDRESVIVEDIEIIG